MSFENSTGKDRLARAEVTMLSSPSNPFMPPTTERGHQDVPTMEAHNTSQSSTSQRPATPPPMRGMQEDNVAQGKHGDDGSSPPRGGLTWRKPGSTHNLFPPTLIGDRDPRRSPVKHLDSLPRLIKRNRAFHQSANKVHLRHNQGLNIYRLLRFNWFHVFLRWPTKYSFTLLMTVWTAFILIFAWIYVWHDSLNPEIQCGLGGSEGAVIDFAAAFAFSLHTCTTVGYGLPFGVNSFFEKGCSGVQIIIFLQSIWSMLFNAFLITFVYNRLGRSETRSVQVLFSDKALVSIVDGQVRFQVRLFDCDSRHPVVEAHVRIYCVMKQRPVPRPLRILQPNDSLGAKLFLSFPNVITHHIDMYSLLHPPVMTMLLKPNGLTLRQVDAFTLNRNDIVCPICGESFGTFERWLNHVRFLQGIERQNDFPVANTHLSLDLPEIEKEPHSKPIMDIEILKAYFKENVSEIICMVEGIDPIQSGSFQALQSYRFEDVHWESYAQFSPCLSIEQRRYSLHGNDRIFSVDLDRYHEIVPDPEGAATQLEEDDEGYTKAERRPSNPMDDGQNPVRVNRLRLKTLSCGISDSLFASSIPRDKKIPSIARKHPIIETV